MRIVIDTNILINASADESSYAFRIIKEVIEGRLEAFATHQMMGENRQMLRKLVRDREYKELLEEFFRKQNIVKVYQPLNVVSDGEDNKLFESAASSGADYIISEDKEVLAVGDYHDTEVITPRDFWTKYQNEKDDGSAWNDWGRMLMGR
ncbi:MAG: putative toxin-antitoxin system toxin component, PIN family [bacterium]|nr:putative toxin-antitoxin system toxin component, PIN family [bacterium]